jgi:hypothetical protein
MRTLLKIAIAGSFLITLQGTASVPKAAAECGYSERQRASRQQSLPGQLQFRPASLLLVSDDDHDSDNGIVGFWRVKFVSKDNPGIPDDTVIDAGFAQWHSDGTEIMNSSRPPATSNFCLGVWRRTGRSTYRLNHFALSSDLSGKLIGPARIREVLTLDQTRDRYEGTFTIDQYDLSGNLLAHIAGQVIATRITVDTPVEDVL